MEFLLFGAALILMSSFIYGPPLFRVIRVYAHLRKRKEYICPETGRPASVQVDAIHAARTVLTSGVADMQVQDCTRWPWRRGCEQKCLSTAPRKQVETVAEPKPTRQFGRQGI
jgi:hypothetical protein